MNACVFHGVKEREATSREMKDETLTLYQLSIYKPNQFWVLFRKRGIRLIYTLISLLK